MWWNTLLQLFFGAAAVLPPAPDVGVLLDERLSFECARSVGNLLNPYDQTGPLFFRGDLAFTSIEDSAARPMLVVNAGAGVYSLPLLNEGVNRIRFRIPSATGHETRAYFISYLPGLRTRPRVFEFGVHHPAPGKDELDYQETPVRRAPELLEHLDYAIYSTASSTLNALTEGRLQRTQLTPTRIADCDHLTRKSPQLARNLKRNLDVVEMIVLGPPANEASRSPASE